ncbi:hypothetical protein THRCLA_22244 [Thraustotheca clavata]|uniref:Methyltransferase type 11 domain-containing protein n=1 Tax=Thraustotheca clavata TaxID=74557 RepID=A0A1V9Z8Q9_9STRA|nr:hypothetical protein THRCLA_22244 [Thraustotheca clavata]
MYENGCKNLCMDARDMEFKNESFDVVIDKSTLDAVMAGANTTALHSTQRIVREIHRVLTPNGIFVSISVHSLTFWQPIVQNLVHCQGHWIL